MRTPIRHWQSFVRRLRLTLVAIALLGASLIFKTPPAVHADTTAISIIPDQMTLSGDVTTSANTIGQCTASWLSGTPTGSIIVGVNPTSCNPIDWHGGSASASIFLPNIYASTIYVIKLSWPDRDGKGLHSPLKNQAASILFDNQLIWSKKTTQIADFGDYYGAEHETIKMTVVVTQSGTHTLIIKVPPETAWDLSNIALQAYPLPSKVQGVGYSPYRGCQSPDGTDQPDTQDIREDLARLLHTSNAIRTYSSTGVNAEIPAIANSLGLPIFIGAWLDNNTADQSEIQSVINLAKTDRVDGVIVGNEYYLRHRTTTDIEYLHQAILQVKNSIPAGIPITTAEIDNMMFDWNDGVPSINPIYRPILDEVDIVMVHIYPFWSGMPVEGAAAFTIARYQAIQTLIEREYPGQGKRVIIGETGWPSAGDPQLQAVPSLNNQRRYMLDFLTLAQQQGVEYFYFDGFDELWKIAEAGRVGQHWGYSYIDRSAKQDFYGTLLPSTELGIYSSLRTDTVIQGKKTFDVYTEWPDEPGDFVPSGWMGDAATPGQVSYNSCDLNNPFDGEIAIRIDYQQGPAGWAGIYWLNPENNWGNLPGGIDLSGASRLTFWARTDTPDAQVKFLIGGIGYATDWEGNALCSQPISAYPDSVCPKIEQTETLNTTWTQYTIDLNTLPVSELSKVVGGFGWVATRSLTFYLDDIVYEFDRYSFADVRASYWAASWIQRLYDAGITGGCSTNPLNYCPDNNVTRDQMAVFLERGMHGSGFSPSTVPLTFTDTTGDFAQYWIEALKSDGITSGCANGLYCPNSPTTRAQMAIFLLKSEHGSSYTPPSATGTKFTDVPTSYWAASWIEQLANEGITSGCATNLYCPDQSVTRAQMAVFLVKTFNLP